MLGGKCGWRHAGMVTLSTLLASGCSSGRQGPPASAPAPATAPSAAAPLTGQRRTPEQPDAIALYRRMGLLAEAGETPFVGTLSFFAGPRGDSTVIVLTVALANRSLKFVSEGDRYRAAYTVALEVRRGTELVRELRSREMVRVLVFRETTRADESVIYRQVVSLAPGQYEMRLTVRDEAVPRGSAIEATVGVPQFVAGSVSSPVLYYEATPRSSTDSLPKFVASPRATAVFGRDSLFSVYAEGYGTGSDFPLRVSVQGEGASQALWSDSVSLPRRGDLFSGTFNVPIGKLGVGVMTLGISRAGSGDTLRVPMFIAFGEDLPVASFNEMLFYLRYYVAAPRLQALREASADTRAALWAALLRETDPNPQTPQHEGLREYFERIALANTRFREEGTAGWLTDRGRVLSALGTPDQTYEPTVADLSQRGRTLVWEYRTHRLQVVFVDQTGFGRWRMTISSEAEFEGVVRRILVGY